MQWVSELQVGKAKSDGNLLIDPEQTARLFDQILVMNCLHRVCIIRHQFNMMLADSLDAVGTLSAQIRQAACWYRGLMGKH